MTLLGFHRVALCKCLWQTLDIPKAPNASRPEAVGMVDFTAKRGAKERAAMFQSVLLPDPDTVMEKVRGPPCLPNWISTTCVA